MPVPFRIVLITAVVLIAAVGPALATDETVPTCRGLEATIFGDTDGDGVIKGTPDRDVILGTPGPDLIKALGGNDVVCGRGGNDKIVGGYGRDVILGQAGDDNISGGPGADRIYAGWGDDQVTGGWGKDLIEGGEDDDTLSGGAATDVLRGKLGNDILRGNKDDDILEGGRHSDRLYAGGGVDLLDGGPEFDACGGTGARQECEIRPGRRPAEFWRDVIAPHLDPLGQTENALRIIPCESHGDPFLVNSRSGASGLFQFIESTWNWVARYTDSPSFKIARFEPEWQAINTAWLVDYSIRNGLSNGPWAHWAKVCRDQTT